MRGKFIFFSIFCIILFGCQEEKGLTIENSTVEIGSLQDTDDRALHFRVEITDYRYEQVLEYKVRFIIKNSDIRDLIGSEKIEIGETYKSNDGGLITGSTVEIKKEFNVDEIRKSIENDEAVIVELYNEDQIIKREVVTTFKENIKQLVKINSETKMKIIELNDPNEIAIFRRVVSNSTKINYVPANIPHPKYRFSLGNESYFLWITEDDGKIMHTKDTFSIYSLSDSSLKEIEGILE